MGYLESLINNRSGLSFTSGNSSVFITKIQGRILRVALKHLAIVCTNYKLSFPFFS